MLNSKEKILEIVQNNAGIEPDDVRHMLKMAWFDFDPILDEMIADGLIRAETRTAWGRNNEYTALFVGNGRRSLWD